MIVKTIFLLLFSNCLISATIFVENEALLLYKDAQDKLNMSDVDLVLVVMGNNIESLASILSPAKEKDVRQYKKGRLSVRLSKKEGARVHFFERYDKIKKGYSSYMESIFLLNQMKEEGRRFKLEKVAVKKRSALINFIVLNRLLSSKIMYLRTSFSGNGYFTNTHDVLDHSKYFHMMLEDSTDSVMLTSVLAFTKEF